MTELTQAHKKLTDFLVEGCVNFLVGKLLAFSVLRSTDRAQIRSTFERPFGVTVAPAKKALERLCRRRSSKFFSMAVGHHVRSRGNKQVSQSLFEDDSAFIGLRCLQLEVLHKSEGFGGKSLAWATSVAKLKATSVAKLQ